MFDLGKQVAVVESRIEIDYKIHFASGAFELPNEFVLRP